MSISAGLSLAIVWSVENFDSAIAWEITDGTDTSFLIPYDYFEYGYWAILVGYFLAFLGIHSNKRYGLVLLGITVLIAVVYDTAMGICLSHHVTRALTQLDYLVLGLIFTMAWSRLNAVPTAANATTADSNLPT